MESKINQKGEIKMNRHEKEYMRKIYKEIKIMQENGQKKE